MSVETLKFFSFIAVVFIGCLAAVAFVYVPTGDDDSPLDSFWEGGFYVLAAFFGGEDGAWSDASNTTAIVFVMILGIFGMLLSVSIYSDMHAFGTMQLKAPC